MIYISTSCLKGKDSVFVKDVFEVLEVYRKLGIKNIELGAVHSGKVDINRLKRHKEENDVNFITHCFFPPIKERFMLNLASQNEDTIKKSLRFMKNSIDVCNEIEADLYGLHPGYVGEIDLEGEAEKLNPYERAFETAVGNVSIIADYAADYGIKIAVENQNALKAAHKIFCKAEDFEKLFRVLNKKSAGLLLDIGHLHFASNMMDFNKEGFIKKLKDKVFEMHMQKAGEEKDDHLKIDEKTVKGILKYFDKNSLEKIKLTLESVRLSEKDILDCKGILVY